MWLFCRSDEASEVADSAVSHHHATAITASWLLLYPLIHYQAQQKMDARRAG